MLKIHEKFKSVNANNFEHGNINHFLQNVLIEAATENYRQTLQEYLYESENSNGEPVHLDPPLRANERVISGIFFQALSKTSLRARPEVRIDRLKNNQYTNPGEEDNEDEGKENSAGRVDFIAWTSNRTIAIELKTGTMNIQSSEFNAALSKRWKTVCKQIQTAQNYLRDIAENDSLAVTNPLSLSIRIVVGQRNIKRNAVQKMDEEIEQITDDFSQALRNSADPSPQFIATYTFPQEFRVVSRRKRGRATYDENECAYIPCIGVIARLAINRT